jgi:hypothetical protein
MYAIADERQMKVQPTPYASTERFEQDVGTFVPGVKAPDSDEMKRSALLDVSPGSRDNDFRCKVNARIVRRECVLTTWVSPL